MKTVCFILLLIFGCNSQEPNTQGKNTIPDWIIGKWSNSGCSDINKTIIIEFDAEHLFMRDNMFAEKKDIIKQYNNRKATYVNKDGYFGLFFINDNDTVSYEFKLSLILEEKVLLWNFSSKEEDKGFFSNDVNSVLKKEK